MTKNTRFALLLRPQASQSVRTPIKSREPVFMGAMLAARRRGFGKTRLRGCSLDGDYPPARHVQEIHGPEPEDRVRVARRSPDLFLIQEILVHERLGLFCVPHRGHPAYREPGLLPNVSSVGLLDRFGDQFRDAGLVHPIWTAGEDEHWLSGPSAPED